MGAASRGWTPRTDVTPTIAHFMGVRDMVDIGPLTPSLSPSRQRGNFEREMLVEHFPNAH